MKLKLFKIYFLFLLFFIIDKLLLIQQVRLAISESSASNPFIETLDNIKPDIQTNKNHSPRVSWKWRAVATLPVSWTLALRLSVIIIINVPFRSSQWRSRANVFFPRSWLQVRPTAAFIEILTQPEIAIITKHHMVSTIIRRRISWQPGCVV